MVGSIHSVMSSYGVYGVGSSQSIQNTSKIFDYKAAQQDTKKLLEEYKANTNSVNTLKKDSAQFLKEYTNNMNNLNKAADKLTGPDLDKLLTNRQGEVTEETIGNTVNAMKDMVDSYNSNIKFLSDNADRGRGVVNQLSRMVDDPASKEAMEMLGVSVNKDGTLALDTQKMTTALSDASKLADKGQFNLLKDAIGGSTGVARGVEKDAQAGLREPAGTLIASDIAEMQSIQQSDPIRVYAQEVRGSGAYFMNNMAAGIMMNMLA